jgi:hypothetical protein
MYLTNVTTKDKVKSVKKVVLDSGIEPLTTPKSGEYSTAELIEHMLAFVKRENSTLYLLSDFF